MIGNKTIDALHAHAVALQYSPNANVDTEQFIVPF